MIGHILVIEPIAINRIVIKARLSASHYQVSAFDSLKAALAACVTNLPDLVMISSNLGLDALKTLNRCLTDLQLTIKPPVIVIGSEARHTGAQALFEGGADSYLKWPVPVELMRAKVRSLTRRAQKLYSLEHRCLSIRGLTPDAPEHATRPVIVVASTLETARDWTTLLQSRTRLGLEAMSFAEATDRSQSRHTNATYLLISDHEDGPETTLHILATIKTRSDSAAAQFMMMFPDGAELEASAALDMGTETVAWLNERTDDIVARLENLFRSHSRVAALENTLDDGLKLAVTDPLTGLHNRRFCDVTLARICAETHADGGEMALLIIDIDHFKNINDLHGHAAGDYILAQVATTLRAHLRDNDLIARIGGEEFLVALPDTNVRTAVLSANRLRTAIEHLDLSATIDGPPGSIKVTVSIGVSISDGRHSPATLTAKADRALYQAKSSGRNRVCISKPRHAISPEVDGAATTRATIGLQTQRVSQAS